MRATVSRWLALLSAIVSADVASASDAARPAIALGLPIDCEPGRTCFVQNYVDVDPTRPTARDYRCGAATYDNHEGTDFRVLSVDAAEKGVAVLAAAPGRVLRVRDGVADVLFRRPVRPVASAAEQACGNGVVVDHGNGWETQYCHLKQGSLGVKDGDRVERGTRLGLVGFSGMAAFAHVHLSVRYQGTIIDPFTARPPGESCSTSGAAVAGLWQPSVAMRLGYTAGAIIEAGFSSAPVSTIALETGGDKVQPAIAASPALFAYVRVMHVRAGDKIGLEVTGPDGFSIAATSEPVPRDQAIYAAYAGKKRAGRSFRHGIYKGRATLLRGDTAIADRAFEIDLR